MAVDVIDNEKLKFRDLYDDALRPWGMLRTMAQQLYGAGFAVVV